ncbi:MAG: calcium-binding protein, partial [Actinobacteria bacterium]|nr:calcium-binding protein [Actinomycetota bacterium]
SVTSSTNIANVNASGQESFTAANLAGSCTASGTAVSGSTTITGGTLQTDNGDSDPTNSIPDHAAVDVALPAGPPANATYTGHIHIGNTTDNFRYVFNERVVSTNSITVNAAHNYLLGPSATGDMIIGQSVCGVTVDTVAPDTSITSGPANGSTINDPTPRFDFQSNDPGASFKCRVDSDPFTSCTSPKTTARLTDGAHTFEVKAIDAAGNEDATPASRSFTVATGDVKVSGSTLQVTAATGASDNIRITKPSSSTFTVTDSATTGFPGSGLHVGAGCTLISDERADCSATGIASISVAAGDRADRAVNDTASRSTLNGGSGDDYLAGGSYAAGDLLDGGTGADDLLGRAGVDTVSYAGRAGGVTVTVDSVANDGGVEDANAGATRRDNVSTDIENVTGGNGGDTITGSGYANVLSGGPGGDVLDGASANDVLDGGAGADDLAGGTGADRVTYASSTSGVTVTIEGTANDGNASDDNGTRRDNVKTDVEQLTGSPQSDTLTGSGTNDVIDAGAGDDTINGGSGADSLDGGAGADNFNGGAQTDTATYASRTTSVTVKLNALADDGGTADYNGTRRDNVADDVENVIGGSAGDTIEGNGFSNVLTGKAGGDIISGANGNDTLDGGAGADDLSGGGATDTATYASSTDPVTVTIDGIANDGGTADYNGTRRDDVKTDVENLIGGPKADSLSGNAGANTITGGLGADTLRGLDGNDVLKAFDGVVDTSIDCDGGASPGSADSATIDATDPAPSGCETVG